MSGERIHNTGGSLQLRLYRLARADGATAAEATVFAGITCGEAALIENDDARRPPMADDCAVPVGMLPGIRVTGDPATLAALCGPWGRA